MVAIIVLYVKNAHKGQIKNASEVFLGLFLFVVILNILMGLCTMCNFPKDEEEEKAEDEMDNEEEEGEDE